MKMNEELDRYMSLYSRRPADVRDLIAAILTADYPMYEETIYYLADKLIEYSFELHERLRPMNPLYAPEESARAFLRRIWTESNETVRAEEMNFLYYMSCIYGDYEEQEEVRLAAEFLTRHPACLADDYAESLFDTVSDKVVNVLNSEAIANRDDDDTLRMEELILSASLFRSYVKADESLPIDDTVRLAAYRAYALIQTGTVVRQKGRLSGLADFFDNESKSLLFAAALVCVFCVAFHSFSIPALLLSAALLAVFAVIFSVPFRMKMELILGNIMGYVGAKRQKGKFRPIRLSRYFLRKHRIMNKKCTKHAETRKQK